MSAPDTVTVAGLVVSEDDASSDDFYAYLKLMNRDIRCEICHSQNWYAVTGSDENKLLSAKTATENADHEQYTFEFYSYVCLKCGNTKTFNKLVTNYNIAKIKQINRGEA